MKRQCAYMNDTSDLSVDMNWTHEQVDAYFKTIFAVPMAYAALAATAKSSYSAQCKGKASAVERPCWALISKEKQRYTLVKEYRPTGMDLHHHRGRRGCTTQEAWIIIGHLTSCTLMSITNIIL